MITPLLTEKQKQESAIRMNGNPTRLADAFSAQLAKQITDKEELLFKIICIKNALEMGCHEIALEHCNRALRR